jgi:hypothetical protein
MSKKAEAIRLLVGIDEGLKGRFNELRNKHFNPNTKGYEYEKILKEFLESYLSGLYDFHVRTPLIDAELEALSIFTSAENEFDVVSTYKTAIPRIVLKINDTSFIPYDAVAFIVEVKQTLTKAALENDLKKLDKLSKLKTSESRFGAFVYGDYVIQRPLRILFYYESEIADITTLNLLSNYGCAWDLMAVLMDNIMFGNPSLPIIGKHFKTDKILRFTDYPLLQLMIAMTTSLPCPIVANAWPLFINLLSIANANI